MTQLDWWERLTELADRGPRPGQFAKAEASIAAAERMTAAKALIHPSGQPSESPPDSLPGDTAELKPQS